MTNKPNLEFEDKVRQALMGPAHAVMPPPIAFADIERGIKPTAYDDGEQLYEYRVTFEFGYNMTAPKHAKDQVRIDAISALKRHLYGEIRDELVQVYMDLKYSGWLSADDENLKKIDALMSKMRP